jgi:hypothetical protein
MILKRVAALSPTRILVIAAIWPLLLILVVVLFIAIEVARANRSPGLIAIGFNVSRSFLTLLVLPPLAFIGLAAAARRRSSRR